MNNVFILKFNIIELITKKNSRKLKFKICFGEEVSSQFKLNF